MITFDPVRLEQRAAELEAQMSEPGFWDDQQQAAQISTEHSRVTKRLERYRRLSQEYDDAAELAAMDGEMADEIAVSLQPLRAELARLEEDALFNGEYDAGDAVVTIHAGTGGTDAQDWAEILLRMYLRWAERERLAVTVREALAGDEAGVKSATLEVRGPHAYGWLGSEHGVHRLVRLSPFDAAHRRHTSFASVDVIPDLGDEVEIEIDPDDLRIDTFRAGGPGGQFVNTTDSAVRITHIPTGITASVQSERSQLQNRTVAMKHLRSRLADLQRQEREKELSELRGVQRAINFGSQIRSYVQHPYQMVKDHRTGFETSSVDKVLDGDLAELQTAYLQWRRSPVGAGGGIEPGQDDDAD